MHELPQMHAKISSNFRKVPQVLQGYDKRTGVLWTPFSIPGLLGAFVVNITLRLYPWSPSNPCPLPLTIHLRNYDIVRDANFIAVDILLTRNANFYVTM